LRTAPNAAIEGHVDVNQHRGSTERDDIRVIVVEDHDLFREGLCMLLEREGMTVVGQADNGQAAIDMATTLVPDVILMDLDLPQVSGIEATRRIAAEVPSTHVLVLTISRYEEDVLDALLAGATGYLVKGMSPESLIRGIRAAVEGNSLLSPGVAAQLLGRVRASTTNETDSSALAEILSEREVDVLRLLAGGKHNAEIARELYLSPHTVRNHISNILAKLDISNRTEATAVAIRAGLV
jgi:DNA-binding NarL/FixJ family response regulator